MEDFHPSYEYDFDAGDQNNTAAAVYRMARAGGKRVLDLGSGPGIVSSRLTREDGRSVTCVDGDAERLAVALERGVERTVLADLDGDAWVDELGGERFDVVILADVLEHLVAPEAVLDAIRRHVLTDDGFIVVSIPNASHEAILSELMTGRFTYREAGLLDATHLRFFTKDSLVRLAEAHGFRITDLHRTVLPLEDTEMRARAGDLPLTVRTEIMRMNPECRTYQFVARLDPRGAGVGDVRAPPPEPIAHDDGGRGPDDETFVDHLVALSARPENVLAVGAGTAEAAARLVARGRIRAIYVDSDPGRLDAARARGIDRTMVAPVADGSWIDMLAGESFDAIILGDLLERSVRPDDLLDGIRSRGLLATGGAIMASVRNMSSSSAIAELFGADAAGTHGLIGSDRLRFFTRRSVIDTCERHGFVLQEVRRIPDPSASWASLPAAIRDYLAEAPDTRTSHFVFRAEPAVEAHELVRLHGRIERLEEENRRLLEETTAERRGLLALYDRHDRAVRAQEALRAKADRFREAAEAQRRLAEERRSRLAAIYRSPSWRVARLLAAGGRALRRPSSAVRGLRSKGDAAVEVPPQPEPVPQELPSASDPRGGTPEAPRVAKPSGGMAAGVVPERSTGASLRRGGRDGSIGTPQVSIVIPVYNGLEVTRQCLESIFAGTIGASFEVIVVDNASSDGVSAWLGAQRERWPNMTLISNRTNRGFGPGVNQGAEATRGEYILICNSDVIIPAGSLDRLVQALDEHPDIGVVSPVTNYVGEGLQRDVEASDATPETVAEHAARAAERNAPLAYVPDRLVFFCVLARKGLFDLLGGFPEAYGIGNFEDDDFCVRTRIAGYRLAIDPNAFVFHHGSATWQGTDVSHKEWMQRNRPIYFQRLATLSTTLVPRTRPAVRQPEITVVVRTVDRPHLLREALVSLANQTFEGFEVVVVNDGGPSVEPLVEELGRYVTLRYVHHPDGRGRAAALNSGLAAARGSWITYLDDDDIVYPIHLDVLFDAVRETRFRVVYGDTNRVLCRGDGRRNDVVQREPYGSFEFHPTRLLVANRLPIHTIIHAIDCVAAIGQFDEGIDLLEDWDFVIRLSRRFPFHHVRRVTSEYRFRVSTGAGNAMISQREDVLASQLAIYERYPVSDAGLERDRSDQIDSVRTQIERIRDIRRSASSDAAKSISIARIVSGLPMAEDEQAGGPGER